MPIPAITAGRTSKAVAHQYHHCRILLSTSSMSTDYDRKLHEQQQQYANVEDIHALPEIFHYWSNRHLRPRLNTVAKADSPVEFYGKAFLAAIESSRTDAKFASLGSGDATVEVEVAQFLLRNGLSDFTIRCLEVAPVLANRANERIESLNLQKFVSVEHCDLNSWSPAANSLHGVMANHSLHHMVELETIFDAVRRGLTDHGIFATNDVIGRNGHMRWPEVKSWIDSLWPTLPSRLKYNHPLKRQEESFLDWDCSVEGFEGIRAQDILPLLCKRFHFSTFLPYGGLVDIFIDRGFGHNFSMTNDYDARLIDFLEFANQELIDGGRIKPTMMFATMHKLPSQSPVALHRGWTPEFCVRPVEI
jgi:hypothetical protein